MSQSDRISELQEELAKAQDDAKSGVITGRMSGLKGALGLGTSKAALMGIAHTDSPLSTIAGEALLPLIAIQSLTNRVNDTRVRTQNQAIQHNAKNVKGNYNFADLMALNSNRGKVTSTGTNVARGLALAAAALTGSTTLQTAAAAPLLATKITKGPMSALMGLTGAGMALNAGTGLYGGMMAAPSAIMGGIGGGLVSGAGGLLSGLGASTAGSAISSVGGGITAAGSKAAALTLGGGFGITAALPAILLAGMLDKKLQTFAENRSSGLTAMKFQKVAAPQLQSAYQLESIYGRSQQVDSFLNSIGTNSKTSEQAMVGYLTAIALYSKDIASSNSLLRPIIEELQSGSSAQTSFKVGETQNDLQRLFGFTGDAKDDLTKAYSDPSGKYKKDSLKSLFGPGLKDNIKDRDWWDRLKYQTGEALVKTSRATDLGLTAINPFSYFMGKENSFMGKLKSYDHANIVQEVKRSVSKTSGISLNFIDALETTSLTLSSKGESPQEKLVALTSGLYELARFRSFRLQDIANHMGATKDSSMGAVDELVSQAEDNQDNSSKKMGIRLADWMGGSNAGLLTGAGAGLGLAGILGLGATGAAVGAGAGVALGPIMAYMAYQRYKKNKEEGNILSAEDAIYGNAKFSDIHRTDRKGNGLLDENGNAIMVGEGIDLSSAFDPNTNANISAAEFVDSPTTVDQEQLNLIAQREQDSKIARDIENNNSLTEINKNIKKLRKCTDCTKKWDSRFESLTYVLRNGKNGNNSEDDGDINIGGIIPGSEDKKKKSKKKKKAKNPRNHKNPKTKPKAKFKLPKGAGTVGKVATGVAGKALVAYNAMTEATDVYHWIEDDEPLSYSTMGGITGGIIGGVIGGTTTFGTGTLPAAAVGNAAGSLIGTGLDLVLGEPELSESERKSKHNKRGFEASHPKWFNWIDDGRYFKNKKNKTYFRHDNGTVWDIATNKQVPWPTKKEINILKDSPDARPAEELFQEQLKAAAAKGGDKSKIDSSEELQIYLDAIWRDQAEISKLSSAEAQNLQTSINMLIEVVAQGNSNIVRSLNHTQVQVLTTEHPSIKGE